MSQDGDLNEYGANKSFSGMPMFLETLNFQFFTRFCIFCLLFRNDGRRNPRIHWMPIQD